MILKTNCNHDDSSYEFALVCNWSNCNENRIVEYMHNCQTLLLVLQIVIHVFAIVCIVTFVYFMCCISDYYVIEVQTKPDIHNTIHLHELSTKVYGIW